MPYVKISFPEPCYESAAAESGREQCRAVYIFFLSKYYNG